MKAYFVTVYFPIEINSIKLSSESLLSQGFEIVYKAVEFVDTPFFDWEICAPRSQSQSNGDTFLFKFCQVLNEKWCGIFNMPIEAVWKVPCLLLTTTVCIILSGIEPWVGLIDLDVSNHRNLVYWSHQSLLNGNLMFISVNLGS